MLEKIITNLNLLKTRMLQLEFLAECSCFIYWNKNIDSEEVKKLTLEELDTLIESEVERATGMIPPEMLEKFDSEDYTGFTDKYHGNAYWNEIPLPHLVFVLFDAARKVLGYEFDATRDVQYEISLYDLSDETLYFLHLEAAEKVLKDNCLLPYTLCKVIKTGNGYESKEIRCE